MTCKIVLAHVLGGRLFLVELKFFRNFAAKKIAMDVFEMKFAKVYPMLIAKAERKARTADEVYEVTGWLTGYTKENLLELLQGDSTYGEFLDRAPRMNPDRLNVKGKICGVRIEEIADPRMRDLRVLDKLVDDLAKGKAMEKIIGGCIVCPKFRQRSNTEG